jgi:hypothetical protein
MKKILILSSVLVALFAQGCATKANCSNKVNPVKKVVQQKEQLFPPNAELGKCYRKVFIPAKYVLESRQVLVKEESEKLITIPAKYKLVNEKVKVEDSHNTWLRKNCGPNGCNTLCLTKQPERNVIVQKRVLVEPAKVIRKTIPAVYKTIKTRRKIANAKYIWQEKTCNR